MNYYTYFSSQRSHAYTQINTHIIIHASGMQNFIFTHTNYYAGTFLLNGHTHRHSRTHKHTCITHTNYYSLAYEYVQVSFFSSKRSHTHIKPHARINIRIYISYV